MVSKDGNAGRSVLDPQSRAVWFSSVLGFRALD